MDRERIYCYWCGWGVDVVFKACCEVPELYWLIINVESDIFCSVGAAGFDEDVVEVCFGGCEGWARYLCKESE